MLKIVFLYMVLFYQKTISPFLPRSCRYYPTCSQFAKEHFLKNSNVFFALYEILKRICRCNQLFDGGFDYPIVKKSISINVFNINQNIFKIKYFYLKIDNKRYILIRAI